MSMHIGQAVTVPHNTPGRDTARGRRPETLTGTVEYVSPRGWVTVRTERDYRESFWLRDIEPADEPDPVVQTQEQSFGAWLRGWAE